jgi:hypothetical protein
MDSNDKHLLVESEEELHIATLLRAFRPVPSKRFNDRMAGMPWTRPARPEAARGAAAPHRSRFTAYRYALAVMLLVTVWMVVNTAPTLARLISPYGAAPVYLDAESIYRAPVTESNADLKLGLSANIQVARAENQIAGVPCRGSNACSMPVPY